MYKRILFSLLLIIVSFISLSQNIYFDNIVNDYMTKFERIGKNEGLSNEICNVIYQDRYGFIWIGTEKGLNRYDGYDIIHYLNSDKDSTTISGNFISDICEDKFGDLWISTHNGLNKYNREAGSFTHFFKSLDKNSLRDNYIRALYPDSIGHLWIETLDGTLSKLDIMNKVFQHYSHEKIVQEYYSYHSIIEDNKHNIWIGGRGLGPCYFNQKTETFKHFGTGVSATKKRDKDIACYFIDRDNNFWVSATDGIYIFYPDKEYFKKFLGTSTYSIIQDNEGFMWFGSGKGAYRYDVKKKELINYVNDENNFNSISSNHINDIIQDKIGNIWFATNKGVCKLNQSINQFGHIYHIPENNNSLASNKITDIVQDKKGYLWIGFKNKGFDKYDIKDKSYTHFNKQTEKGLKSNYVSKLYFDKDQILWIGLWRGVGFNSYNPRTGKFEQFAFNPNSKKYDWYSDFLEDRNGNFWVGIWGSKGLHQFERNKKKFNYKHLIPLNKALGTKIKTININRDNILWIGTNSNIIYKYDLKSNEFTGYKHSNNPKLDNIKYKSNKLNYTKLFRFKKTIGLLSNKKGDEIIITDKGIIIYNYLNNRFETFKVTDNTILRYSYFKNQNKIYLISKNTILAFNLNTLDFSSPKEISKFAPDSVISFAELGQHSIIVNTYQKVILLDLIANKSKNIYTVSDNEKIYRSFLNFDKQIWISTNKGLKIYNLEKAVINNSLFGEFNNIEIFNLINDSLGNTWLGTNNGLYKFYGYKIINHYIYDKYKSILSNKVYSLSLNKDSNIWVGTENGLCKLDIKTNSFRHFNQASDESLNSHLVSVLYEDNSGNIWIGTTDKGLNKYNPITGKIEHFTNINNDTLSISSNNISCIFEDKGQNIWIGTMKGLNLLNKTETAFQRINLSGRAIFSIIQDNKEFLWLATDNGLIKFNTTNFSYNIFYESDGLQGNKFGKAACKLQNGQLVFGGEKGINIFYPDKIVFEETKPKIQFTAFEIFNKVIKSDLTQTKEISLSYDDNFFTICFSSLNFRTKDKKYLYKLNEVDPDWVTIQNDPKASYTDIKPGEYLFQVKSVLRNGDESNPVSITIIIHPPFWQTWWFYSIAIILILSISLWIINLRFKKYKTEKENLELEQKLLRSQMNPHFIFNTLMSIQNFIYSKDVKNADKFLTKFSRLLRLTLQNSRKTFITLDDEINTIRNYLELQKLRFEEKFNYSFIIDSGIDTENILIPPMLAQPFIENSIEHGFIEKLKKYNLNINIRFEDNKIVYTIEDDGIGIKKSIEMKQSSNNSHESLGMQITKERILNLKKNHKQNIEFKIEDINTINKNKQGTRVVITIEIKTS